MTAAKKQAPQPTNKNTLTGDNDIATQAPTMKQYELVKGLRLMQPSTGIYIVRGTVTELKADSWAAFQVESGLLTVK